MEVNKNQDFINNATDETISWNSITQSNDADSQDPIKALLGNQISMEPRPKRGRGRPKKEKDPSPALSMDTIAAPVQPTSIEEQMTNQELINMFSRADQPEPEQSIPRRKSSLKFSDDKQSAPSASTSSILDTNITEDPERVTLINLYKQYFKEPLISKHKRKERVWADSNLNSEIYREIKALENAVSEDDPASSLGSLWVGSMGAIEALGPAMGLQTDGLTVTAAMATQDPGFKSTMRELLLKYPYLRVMIGLGGYPELKLLLTTVTLIKEIHYANLQSPGQLPVQEQTNANIPKDIRTAFDDI